MSETVNSIKAATVQKISDPIWIDNFQILFQTNRLNEFFPTKKQSDEERLNSILRLAFYVSILLCIYHSSIKYSSIFVFILIFTLIIYKHHPMNVSNSDKINLSIRQQTQLDAEKNAKIESTQPHLNNFTPSLGLNEQTFEMPNVIENLQVTSSPTLCTKPTVANPFGNFTMSDMMTFDSNGNITDRPPACDANNPDIKKEIDTAFNNNLFHDTNDLFGKMNSQRNFYTMPWTQVVNDRETFQKWLYLNPATCKENQDNCLNYEDLRSKSFSQYEKPKVSNDLKSN